jgi:glycosyltransferase involved in cell wall biosynthesis
MIFFDHSRTHKATHRSGLTRVTTRLLKELRGAVQPIAVLCPGDGGPASTASTFRPNPKDWLLTAELFSEAECPGLWNLIRARRCRLAAIFHDAIPLKHPHITWPQSVGRHPEYMKMLAEFDQVFAVSEASRTDLIEFWRWQGVEPRAQVKTIALGADFASQPRVGATLEAGRASLLCVGILEPRKNQTFLLDVCDSLWRDGLAFDLRLVGRVNPHFGKPVLAKIQTLKKKWSSLHFHEAIDDADLAVRYREARASVFPTIAEGCGLPLLESLWLGVPCVCSDLPVLRENADAGGCVPVTPNDFEAWRPALRRVLTDAAHHRELVKSAVSRSLPTWSDTAKSLLARLG